MKLDSRILEGKKPLDCFDTDMAKQFIGKKGYFCDHRSGFKNISDLVEDVLRDITPDDNYCEVYKTNCTSWEYFLPEEWIKEPEEKLKKKYRAFTIKEFQQKYSVGSVLQIRQKQNRFTESVVQYTGYKVYEERVYLGITDFTLDELFENFEMIEPQNDTWQPFGMIDEDKE